MENTDKPNIAMLHPGHGNVAKPHIEVPDHIPADQAAVVNDKQWGEIISDAAQAHNRVIELEALVKKLRAAMGDFGGYAKVLMMDSHVTPEYLEAYREKFADFEKVYDTCVL